MVKHKLEPLSMTHFETEKFTNRLNSGIPKEGNEDPSTYLRGTRVCVCVCVCVLVTQSCLTLCDPMHCSPASLLSPWDSPSKSTGVGCHSLLRGIFMTLRSNPGLLHCRQILYHLSHQGSPWMNSITMK